MNHKRKKCLVLLASYNGAGWLSEQLKSILSQKNVDVHVYISDDNSSDFTVDFINEIYQSDPRILMSEKSLGSGSAGQNFMSMFREISVSNAEYIAFSDQDDIWFGT